MILMILLTIIPQSSLARMPATLPDYELTCRAGSMTTLKVFKIGIQVKSEQGLRMGYVKTESETFTAPVRSQAIMLVDSIGGRGFEDAIMQKFDGTNFEMTSVRVRGDVDDDIIEFRYRPPDRRVIGNYTGYCTRITNVPVNGLAQ